MQLSKVLKIVLLSTIVTAITAEAFAVEAVSTLSLNVRTGPGKEFSVIDTLYQGEVVNVTECQANGWCHIDHNGPNGWVSGKFLSAANQPGGNNQGSGSGGSNDAAAAAVILGILGIGAAMMANSNNNNNPPANPPQPDPNSLPYGPDTCKQGFVWRDAIPGDHVCVIPQRRAIAANENATAGLRVDPNGAYGPNSCKQGFVWREAYQGDVVCVTAARRTQVHQENIDGPSHRVIP